MLPNKKWLGFFHDIKNKHNLFNLFVRHLCANDFVNSSMLPILVNNGNEIFKISSSVTKVFKFNHEEGDTRIIFHALQQKTYVVVCLKDTDVLVLMVLLMLLIKLMRRG